MLPPSAPASVAIFMLLALVMSTTILMTPHLSVLQTRRSRPRRRHTPCLSPQRERCVLSPCSLSCNGTRKLRRGSVTKRIRPLRHFPRRPLLCRAQGDAEFACPRAPSPTQPTSMLCSFLLDRPSGVRHCAACLSAVNTYTRERDGRASMGGLTERRVERWAGGHEPACEQGDPCGRDLGILVQGMQLVVAVLRRRWKPGSRAVEQLRCVILAHQDLETCGLRDAHKVLGSCRSPSRGAGSA